MILPASYLNGFAPRDGQPLYPSLWKGCVGAWNPGLGPSGLTLRDQSGFQNNGTLTNGPTFAASQGKYGIKFLGLSTYSSLSDRNFPTGAKPWTISAWANTAVTGESGSIQRFVFSWGTASVSQRGTMALQQSKLSYPYYGGALYGNTSLAINTWYPLAIVYDGATVSFFVNGLRDGTTSFVPSITLSGTSSIGSPFDNLGNSSYTWNGLIDDVRLYNRALSPDEIRTLSTRRGIAYEMAPRRRSSAQSVVSYSTFRPSVLRGSR